MEIFSPNAPVSTFIGMRDGVEIEVKAVRRLTRDEVLSLTAAIDPIFLFSLKTHGEN